jgi:type I restriction enzyme, S subunit
MTELKQWQTLPNNWTWTKVGDIAKNIQYGLTTSAQEEPVGPKFLRITDIQNDNVNWSTVPFCRCSEEDYAKYALKSGDILFARTGATTGKSYLLQMSPRAVFASYLIRLQASSRVDPKYIAYFFQSNLYWSQISAVKAGSAQPGVNASKLASLILPIAPPPEQRRIVEAIETHFTRLDAAVAALKRVQANLRRYRASVLKAACEGHLVPTEAELARAEGREYEPASVLLERILAERRAKWERENSGKKYKEPAGPDTNELLDLPAGWCWATVEQIAEQRLGKMLDKAKNKGELRPYLRNINVRWFNFDFSDVQYMRVQDEELENVTIRQGDLVVCEGGEPGRAAVWNREDANMVIQKALHRVRPERGILPWYLAIKLRSDANSGQLEKFFTGSTIWHFTGESLRSYAVGLPPTSEQHRIVAEVERLLSVIDAQEQAVTASLTRAERLRQSILQRAFAGQLMPQDPSDEPASVLLERIRAAKQGEHESKPVQPKLFAVEGV